jgi:hypothetical protein
LGNEENKVENYVQFDKLEKNTEFKTAIKWNLRYSGISQINVT